MTSLQNFRAEKDAFFAEDERSPLSPDERRAFHGLDYFAEDPSLRVEATVQEFPEKQEIQIQTSTGDVRYFERFGRFIFNVDGTPVSLTLYRNDMGYFLPFTDSLAGNETYPAGRYIEPEELGGGRFLVDFNYAYNPSCHYNPRWVCPLALSESRLAFPVPAGEKQWIT